MRETKSTAQTDALRGTEANKIACGRKHFAAIDVDFDVATSLSQTLRELRSRNRAAGVA